MGSQFGRGAGVWPADMRYCDVSCPPAARAKAATALLGGLGHRLLSAPLSAASLTDRVKRERPSLYCGTIAKKQKKKTTHLMTV